MESVARDACPGALVRRLTSVQGVRQSSHHLVPSMVAQARAGEVMVLQGARRDVVDVLDLVPILRALVASGITGEVLNVASGHSVAAEDLAEAVVARQEHPVRVVRRASRSGPEVSIAKLRSAVPPALTACFTAGYGLSVLRRYVGYYSQLSALDAAVSQSRGFPQPATRGR
jgi:dTDP-4-dehydrorhamnose reductase